MLKIQDGGGRHVEKSKNHHIGLSATAWPISRNDEFDPLDSFDGQNSEILKLEIAAAAILKQVLSSSWDGRPFAHNRHGPDIRRCVSSWDSWVPI